MIVVINLRDLREWKRYVAEREENIAALGDFKNPHYQSNTTTTRNPNWKSFFVLFYNLQPVPLFFIAKERVKFIISSNCATYHPIWHA